MFTSETWMPPTHSKIIVSVRLAGVINPRGECGRFLREDIKHLEQ
jgi:hypothetical protein